MHTDADGPAVTRDSRYQLSRDKLTVLQCMSPARLARGVAVRCRRSQQQHGAPCTSLHAAAACASLFRTQMCTTPSVTHPCGQWPDCFSTDIALLLATRMLLQLASPSARTPLVPFVHLSPSSQLVPSSQPVPSSQLVPFVHHWQKSLLPFERTHAHCIRRRACGSPLSARIGRSRRPRCRWSRSQWTRPTRT